MNIVQFPFSVIYINSLKMFFALEALSLYSALIISWVEACARHEVCDVHHRL